MNNEKSIKLNNTKWILTLLLVLYHIDYRDGNEQLFMFIKNLGDCVVPAFSLISGFLFWRNIDSYRNIRNKIENRIFTLMIPYILWNLINSICLNILDISLTNINKHIFDINIFDDILLWNSSPHFWYIFMLMFWSIFSPLLYFIYKKKIFILLLLLIQISFLIYKNTNILNSEFIYIIYTWGGIIGVYKPDLFEYINNWTKRKKITISIISFILYFTIGILMCFFSFNIFIKIWLYFFRGIFIILGTINLPLLIIGKKSNYKYTFWIFAVHYWFDAYIGNFISRYMTGIIYQFITFSLVLMLGIISGFIVYKIIPRGYKYLTGNR